MQDASAPAKPSGHDRLRGSLDIRRVLRHGRWRPAHTAVVHVRERDGATERARVAVIASRKVGGAVARNRAKRLLRETARATSWRAGIDVVLVARRACAEAGLAEVERDVVHAATRLDATAGAMRMESR